MILSRHFRCVGCRLVGNLLPLVTLLVIVLVSGGCSGGGSKPTDTDGDVRAVTVGNLFFRSKHNGTMNPAVDTIAAGTTVTWTWTGTDVTSHNVESTSSPGFASSGMLTGNGQTYSVTFSTPGTYEYDCAIHGTAMTGRIVVQ